MFIVDKFSHGHGHSHNHEKDSSNHDNKETKDKLYHLAITTFISLMLHNIPEGCAVLMSSLQSHDHLIRRFFFLLAHNIPEGIMIVLPY